MRPTAEKRHNDYKKAIRKRRIDKETDCTGHPYYDNLHQYSKNKIHCSCPICRAKTNNKHRKSAYLPNTNYKISDRKKLDQLAVED